MSKRHQRHHWSWTVYDKPREVVIWHHTQRVCALPPQFEDEVEAIVELHNRTLRDAVRQKLIGWLRTLFRIAD